MSSPYRVVVADDDAGLRGLLRIVLESSGRFEVVAEAADGIEAVDASLACKPDLTLLDLEMPGRTGLEALPLIRAGCPQCTVVVLSSFDADRMADRAAARGAAAYLEKGIGAEDLVHELLDALEPPGATIDADAGRMALPPELSAGRDARRFLERLLPRWDLAHLLDPVSLLTTELVTNAVVHARSAVDLTVCRTDGRLRVEVLDRGDGVLERRSPGPDATSGRGLLLVDAIADSWGTTADGAAKIVWFELAVAG